MSSTPNPRQGGDESYFKIPSIPSVSSILRDTYKSSEEIESSLYGVGEASPRLSQFFHPTQESPPQAFSIPRLPETPDLQAPVAPSPPQPELVSTYTPLAVIQERERQRAEEEAAAAEERRRQEEDSFTTVPENLRRKWAMEEKAHEIFEGLRSIKINVKGKRPGWDSQMDDFFFGSKSRVDPDGVRRVIKPVDAQQKALSERGQESDEDTSGADSRKRASTAPVRETRGSGRTIISNSQRSNESRYNEPNATSGTNETNGAVVKETPLESSPNSRATTSGDEGSQDIQHWDGHLDLVTPLRPIKPGNVPSSIPSSTRRVMETPASGPALKDTGESVPETSPVKDDFPQSEEFRTAQESFPQEADSSPVQVPGRRARSGFVSSSIPADGTQRKRDRPPKIQEELSEDEDPETKPAPARKRRRISTAESMDPETNVAASPALTDVADYKLQSHRVFARFKDAKVNYYPATVLEPPFVASSDQEAPIETEVPVLFDDDTQTLVQLRHIRRLTLTPGDTVKTCIDSYKKYNYVVLRVENDPQAQGKPDIANNNVVVVTQKKAGSTEELCFPIDKIFLTGALFAQFNDRRYLLTRLGTEYPVGLASRQVSSSPNIIRAPSGPASLLFQNMVFGISLTDTNKSNSTTKGNLTKIIKAHGGHVVDVGLQEIFHVAEDVGGDLILKPEFSSTKFCAVIADAYSRKPKYLQALALEVPCLSVKWTESCIKLVC